MAEQLTSLWSFEKYLCKIRIACPFGLSQKNEKDKTSFRIAGVLSSFLRSHPELSPFGRLLECCRQGFRSKTSLRTPSALRKEVEFKEGDFKNAKTPAGSRKFTV